MPPLLRYRRASLSLSHQNYTCTVIFCYLFLSFFARLSIVFFTAYISIYPQHHKRTNRVSLSLRSFLVLRKKLLPSKHASSFFFVSFFYCVFLFFSQEQWQTLHLEYRHTYLYINLSLSLSIYIFLYVSIYILNLHLRRQQR